MPALMAAMILAGAQTSAADPARMMARYRAMTSIAPPPGAGCEAHRSDDPSEITVCARDDRSLRLPLPDERAPPDRKRQDTGDARLDPGEPCPPTGCTGVNLLAVPFKVVRIVKALVDPDD